ncbi:Pre-rRNA-processing protein TSR2-domain-containing protein [Phlyctochytrium arcticum]|nr:Pre-rRNA-processing protein TSR2-domain-containing protein [Phlyctochytrium arcticum]
MDAQQQQPSWELFTETVQLVFQQWTALQLALDHQMAGHGTTERAQELWEHTCEFFEKYTTAVMAHEIAENLKDFFDEIFNAELDDGSPEQIGETLVALYKEIMTEGKVDRALAIKEQARGHPPIQSRQGNHDDSSDDDGDEGNDENPTASSESNQAGQAMDVDNSNTSRPEPVIDEDGFELVQPRKRRPK